MAHVRQVDCVEEVLLVQLDRFGLASDFLVDHLSELFFEIVGVDRLHIAFLHSTVERPQFELAL